MAINLKKENIGNEERYPEARTVYPENNAEEIYPQREIYPRSAPQNQTAQEEIYPKPAPQVQTEAAEEAIPQLRTARTLPPQPVETGKPVKYKRKKEKRKKKRHIIRNIIIVCCILTAVFKGMQESFIDRGYEFMFFSDSQYSERTVDIPAADVGSLVITDSNSRIKVIPSSDGDFHITASENDKKKYDISCTDGTARVTGNKVFTLVSFNGNSSVTVEVPDEYMGTLSVECSNAKVECSAGAEINIDNSNGKVDISDITGSSVKVRSSNSTITASNISADELSLINSNGKVEVNKSYVTGNTVLEAGNSRVEAANTVFGSSGNISSDNGSVMITDCELGSDMTVSANNGSVNMEDFSFENLFVKARNGSIKGSAYGEEENYTVKAKATNGSSDIESGGTGKYILELDSNNGSIHFNFDGGRPVTVK